MTETFHLSTLLLVLRDKGIIQNSEIINIKRSEQLLDALVQKGLVETKDFDQAFNLIPELTLTFVKYIKGKASREQVLDLISIAENSYPDLATYFKDLLGENYDT